MWKFIVQFLALIFISATVCCDSGVGRIILVSLVATMSMLYGFLEGRDDAVRKL